MQWYIHLYFVVIDGKCRSIDCHGSSGSWLRHVTFKPAYLDWTVREPNPCNSSCTCVLTCVLTLLEKSNKKPIQKFEGNPSKYKILKNHRQPSHWKQNDFESSSINHGSPSVLRIMRSQVTGWNWRSQKPAKTESNPSFWRVPADS